MALVLGLRGDSRSSLVLADTGDTERSMTPKATTDGRRVHEDDDDTAENAASALPTTRLPAAPPRGRRRPSSSSALASFVEENMLLQATCAHALSVRSAVTCSMIISAAGWCMMSVKPHEARRRMLLALRFSVTPPRLRVS